jgi:23S rRNA (uracil1939-C5)-methyltransferase
MVNLVTLEENDELMKEYSEMLISKFPQITTVINNINTGKAQIAVGEREIVYHGPGLIFDNIGKYKFRISANSFFQTNTLQAGKLYDAALKFGELKKDDVVYDLYSGAGTISIYIAEYVKIVAGFESFKSAIKDAKENSKLNDKNNTKFYNVDLNKSFLPFIKEKSLPKPDVIIVDPPRSGMNPKTIKDILNLEPERIVYVSCNPTTQVRDIKLLCEEKYKLIKIQPVDMFPQTYHIENGALMVKI